MLGGGTALSYYVEALWFESLGYADVFWKTLNLQAADLHVFRGRHLPGAVRRVSGAQAGASRRTGRQPILINGQPLKLPVEPVLRLIALGGCRCVIAVDTGAGMMAEWPTLALYWYCADAAC